MGVLLTKRLVKCVSMRIIPAWSRLCASTSVTYVVLQCKAVDLGKEKQGKKERRRKPYWDTQRGRGEAWIEGGEERGEWSSCQRERIEGAWQRGAGEEKRRGIIAVRGGGLRKLGESNWNRKWQRDSRRVWGEKGREGLEERYRQVGERKIKKPSQGKVKWEKT